MCVVFVPVCSSSPPVWVGSNHWLLYVFIFIPKTKVVFLVRSEYDVCTQATVRKPNSLDKGNRALNFRSYPVEQL